MAKNTPTWGEPRTPWEVVGLAGELHLFTADSPAPTTVPGINICARSDFQVTVFKAALVSNQFIIASSNVDQLTENIMKGHTCTYLHTPHTSHTYMLKTDRFYNKHIGDRIFPISQRFHLRERVIEKCLLNVKNAIPIKRLDFYHASS